MGIDLYVFDFLLGLEGGVGGDVLCLGRQGFHVGKQPGDLDAAQAILARHDAGRTVQELAGSDGYAETFLRYLGARTVLSLDMAAHEQAELIHDLNQPVPEDLRGRFDVVLDCGTSEHIFDFPAAIGNIKAMLRPGGRYIGVNAANNQLGHGLYQFSPELFWRLFAPEQGYTVERMRLVPAYGRPAPIDLTDPAGRRQEIGRTNGPTYLMVAARHTGSPKAGAGIQQSDYAAAWGRAAPVEMAPLPRPALPSRAALAALHAQLKPLVATDPAQLHSFMVRFWRSLRQPATAMEAFVAARQQGFDAALARGPATARPRIPRFTHRIWLTSPAAPAIPPDDYIDPWLRSLATLAGNVTHFFWSNSRAVLAHIAARARAAGLGNVVAGDIAAFNGEPGYENAGKLVGASKYVLAADVMKFLVLRRFGGIYSDLGVIYDGRLLEMLGAAEYGVLLGPSGFFQTSFVAAAPGAALVELFLAVLAEPHCLNPVWALNGEQPTAIDEVHSLAGPGFTAAALLFMGGDAEVLVLPPQSPLLHWRSQRSWYGAEGKNGNALIAETAPTLLSAPALAEAGALAADALQLFGASPLLAERLRLLLLATAHFRTSPTRLCRLFHAHGSDRALGWHDYGHVYTYLLGCRSHAPRRILELSATREGSGPGLALARGALASWREAFPAAQLVAADPNAARLMPEAEVEAHAIDGSDAGAVAGLFAALGERAFDLMVDDGVHRFAAASAFLAAAWPHLAPGGFIVIEDVPDHDVTAWRALLAGGRYPAAMLRLPHPTNRTDNRLIVVERAGEGS